MYMNHTAGFLLQTFMYIVNNTDIVAGQTTDQMETNRVEYTRSTTGSVVTPDGPCYHPFGCFPITAPWSTEDREFPFFPEPPSKIKTSFCLRTRLNPERCQFLDAVNHTTIYESYFEAHNKTYFVVHGFLESMHRSWLQRITEELLKMEECNVVIVDWQGGSIFPYAQAVANIRLVGVMMGFLIRDMITEVGLRPTMVHIIGHSLGAHAASYAGSTLYHKFGYHIGRITGLDAAEPRFTNTDPLVRLDPTDAIFVDVIHTDASPFMIGGLGIREPIGHVDFYPNGGKDQPGCAEGISNFITEKNGNVLRGIEKFLNCNHVRSNEYFIESINGPCKFFGVQCSSYEAYKNGSCFSCGHGARKSRSGSRLGSRCARMGMHVLESVDLGQVIRNKRPMRLFLTTSADAPFCKSQYRVTLTISNSTKSTTHGGEVGIISVSVKGTTGTTEKMQLFDRERYHGPGTTHRSTVIGDCVGTMTSATLSLDYRTSVLNPLTWRLVVMPRIHVASVTIDSLEEADSMRITVPEAVPVIYKKPLECQRSTDKGVGECVPKMGTSFLKTTREN